MVVDTSVVVKLLVDEPDSDKADALYSSLILGTVSLLAPDLVFVESVNALWVKTRRGELAEGEAEEKIGRLKRLCALMEIVPVESIALEAFRNACRYSHAVYDTAFLALAESRGIRFITADEKFYEKARRHSPAPVLLSDLTG